MPMRLMVVLIMAVDGAVLRRGWFEVSTVPVLGWNGGLLAYGTENL